MTPSYPDVWPKRRTGARKLYAVEDGRRPLRSYALGPALGLPFTDIAIPVSLGHEHRNDDPRVRVEDSYYAVPAACQKEPAHGSTRCDVQLKYDTREYVMCCVFVRCVRLLFGRESTSYVRFSTTLCRRYGPLRLPKSCAATREHIVRSQHGVYNTSTTAARSRICNLDQFLAVSACIAFRAWSVLQYIRPQVDHERFSFPQVEQRSRFPALWLHPVNTIGGCCAENTSRHGHFAHKIAPISATMFGRFGFELRCAAAVCVLMQATRGRTPYSYSSLGSVSPMQAIYFGAPSIV